MLNNEGNKEEKRLTSIAKFSATGFQMLATIGLFAFIGHKIDENRNAEKLIFTALFGLAGTIISLYQVIKALKKR